jgi:hypothetical protein
MDQAHFSTLKSGAPKQTKFQSVRLLPSTYLSAKLVRSGALISGFPEGMMDSELDGKPERPLFVSYD